MICFPFSLYASAAAFSAQHIPIDVEEMNIDMLSASGHKFYGPKGVGILYIKKWEGSKEPEVQADPLEAHTPSWSKRISMDSPSIKRKHILILLGRRSVLSPFNGFRMRLRMVRSV